MDGPGWVWKQRRFSSPRPTISASCRFSCAAWRCRGPSPPPCRHAPEASQLSAPKSVGRAAAPPADSDSASVSNIEASDQAALDAEDMVDELVGQRLSLQIAHDLAHFDLCGGSGACGEADGLHI